ncbi:MAG: gfo/Idh/MocA family oxidoreductase, partial [Phycisphaerae bacterium]|nr:gfo/Idh/MocA family oxidoreductase [Phycisphaerae bacterium]
VYGYDGCNRKISLHSQLNKVEKEYLQGAKVKLYKSQDHLTDFMNCIESRKKPITSEIVGGHSAICCHLMNQAYYNHAQMSWDPKNFAFTKGTGDPSWLTRDYRSPWSV